MPTTLADVLAWHKAGKLTAERYGRLSKRDREAIEVEWAKRMRADAQANQLVYYEPVSPEARKIHLTTAREVGLTGGRRSGKTGVLLAELVIQLTGVVPDSLAADYPRQKLRPPIRARLVVTSFVSAWEVNLKQKLEYYSWNGKLNPDRLAGDPRYGTWGLVPQRFLINGDWAQSWSEKHRVLTLANGSTLSVMSHDQDLEEFEQGAYYVIIEDELPPEAVHRANRMRVLDYGGQVYTGGTPPDDRSAAITAAWFFDTIYQPGLAGSSPSDVFATTLWTEHNRTLDEADVQWVTRGLTPEQKEARLHGKFLHLSGLVVRGFTEHPRVWCPACETSVIADDDTCSACGRRDLMMYCHVWDEQDLPWPGPATWPTVFYMDPHQSRPTCCAWFKIDPNDRWWQIHEMEIAGDAAAVKQAVEAFEEEHDLHIVWRKGDPKITVQANQFAAEFGGRPFTIRQAFEEAGFPFDEANTNFTVAVERIEQALKPTLPFRTPRLRVHTTCTRTRYHVTHHVWERSRREPTEAREKPAKQFSDFVALLRYLAMDDPTWRDCQALRHLTPLRIGAGGVGRNSRTGW